MASPSQAQFLLFSYFQAFTVVTVFNSMTFALKVTPFSVKSLSEASVAVDRFKVSGSLVHLPCQEPSLAKLTVPLMPMGHTGCPHLAFVHLEPFGKLVRKGLWRRLN